MPHIATSKFVLPHAMRDAEKSVLADELTDLYLEVYETANRDDVLRTIFDTKSAFSTLLIHRSDEGKVVGYFAIHFHERIFRGKPTVVIRSSVAMRRAYRGNNSNISWAMGVLLKYWLAHPDKPIYGMGPMAHPSSYLHVVRYVDEFWPRPDEPVPPDILAFMLELGDEFQLPRLDPDRPLVRYARLATRETEAERKYWLECDKPAARFFVSTNPNYNQGHGLLTLFPINASMLRHLATRIARDEVQKKLDRALMRAQKLPLGARFLRPTLVRRHLRASAHFANLDPALFNELVDHAEVISMPAGVYVFRQGDMNRDIYLLSRGAVYVLKGSSDETIADQLGVGEFFGGCSSTEPTPQTVSIRTAIPSVFVRIPSELAPSALLHSDSIHRAHRTPFVARSEYANTRMNEPFLE